MVKYIIFDFDGTLVDSKDVFIEAYNQLAEKHNYKQIKNEELEELRKLSIRERCKALNFPMYKIPFFVPELYALYKDSIKDVVLIDGVKELLDELTKRGYRLAIISSNAEENIRQFLLHNEIKNVKEVFCSKNIFGKDKVIKKFLKEKKLQTEEVLYVGDEQRDVVACKKIGVEIIWVGWGYDVLDTIKEDSPDYVVYNPKEITSIVEHIK
ncbi:HAD-IA family hydrolase [Bacillus sp. DX1.1]|uniref:HAD-IA family hydrolase n=1 Tax=unclassified Bacillus (in: firmicutes) TaxID=185979 RepID=UPI00256FD5D4|nr:MULTISPECIES: HAD-IA family hydrolase [unclassified Bacillus (in: firmicutes)]MDM5154786.1 HAD-IA family hydrolase [Bacillus sp. DX1.1]WJE84067.1 HAD-IA family hydrolase [Bacillus sp. DX3.1]